MHRHWNWARVTGFAVAAVLGTLGHFAYDWSGRMAAVGAFCAVNESTWEHMKLLFFPVFGFTLWQLCAERRNAALPAGRAAALSAGLLAIPVLFYTYSGVLGFTVDWMNILIFYLADAALFWLDGQMERWERLWLPWQQSAGLLWLWLLAFLFVFWTFRPPHLGLWQDPVTGLYGLPAVPGS